MATDNDRWGRRTRWRARVGAAVLAMAGGAVALVGMGGAASAAPNPATCEGAELAGGKLFGSDKGAAAAGPAGSGTTSADKRTWEITINKGWTATGVVVRRGPGFEIRGGEYVGPTSVRSDRGGTVINKAVLPPITSWYVCGARTDAAAPGGTEPRSSTDRNVSLVVPPADWQKNAFGALPAPDPNAKGGEDPNAKAPVQQPQPNVQEPQQPQQPQQNVQEPQAPQAMSDELVRQARDQFDASAAKKAPASKDKPAAAAKPASRDDGSKLPVTGVPAGLLAAVGIVLVAGGVGLLYSARRREA